MKLYTGNKEKAEYSAQITPYRGRVNAEIIRTDKDKGFYDSESKCWLTVMNKSFGSGWKSTPSEQNWKDANKWVEKQLSLIKEYSTVMVKEPQYLKDFK